jgi:hypothetical protein
MEPRSSDIFGRLSEATDIELMRVNVEYQRDLQLRSLEYWYQRRMVGKMALETFLEYARVFHWEEQRMAFWRGVAAKWLHGEEAQLLQLRHDEISEIANIRSYALEQLKPRKGADGVEYLPIQPKTWEGAVKAFCDLDKLLESKRMTQETIVGQLLAALSSVGNVEERKGGTDEISGEMPFSREELRHLAHSMLEMRMTQRRAEMGIGEHNPQGEGDEDGDEDDQQQAEPEAGVDGQGALPRSDNGAGGLAG